MSTEQNKTLIRRFGDLINAHDAEWGVRPVQHPTSWITGCRRARRRAWRAAAGSSRGSSQPSPIFTPP